MKAKELLEQHLPQLLERAPAQARQVAAIFVLDLAGEGGGRWTIDLKSDPPTVRSGSAEAAEATVQLTVEDFEAIAEEPSRAFELFFQGKLQVSGDPALAGRLPALLELLRAPH